MILRIYLIIIHKVIFFSLKMDLKQFIQIHEKNGTIDYISGGFQKSQYIENNNDTSNLIKLILNKLISDNDKQKIYNQLQSGGLANHITQNKNEVSKKQSFCTEFNLMISNIIGLLGFEFSKYLFVLFGAKHFIHKLVEELKDLNSYEDIDTVVKYIRNLISLGSENTENPLPIKIDEGFNLDDYINLDESSEQTIDYYSADNKPTTEELLFNWMLKDIKSHIKSENIVTFEEDKIKWYDILCDMIDHLELGTYIINNVNDLIINLGRFNICYDKSFIKMFEILYMESLADIPYEFWSSYKPHVIYIEKELKLDVKCSKYTTNFNKYFHKIYDDTLKSSIDALGTNNVLKINVTDSMYELLSDITLNLFLNISRKISNNQLIYAYFGKSTRIQFIQVFQALMDCAPRLHIFSPSQRAIMHYILLGDKVLSDSIKLVKELQKDNIK